MLIAIVAALLVLGVIIGLGLNKDTEPEITEPDDNQTIYGDDLEFFTFDKTQKYQQIK